jgi:MoaA/NifB/PqqE/SkfB family radical SAM enzyme
MDAEAELGFLKNIGLVITYRCQISCPHCIVEAGPHRTEEMDLADAYAYIKEIAAYRDGHFEVLSLTGGEPFFNLAHLARIAGWASQAGLAVTAVTNAFWAATRDAALATLRKVPFIRMLAVSADVYHLAEIPFERIENAIWASQELGVEYTVAVCTQSKTDPIYLDLMQRLKSFVEAEKINTATAMPVGRARFTLQRAHYDLCEQTPVSACANASAPMILPDGRVVACVGPLIALRTAHPLLLGNARISPLSEILDEAEQNAVLHAIRVWGPHKLVDGLKANGWQHDLPHDYIEGNPCDVCHQLMSNPRLSQALRELDSQREFRERVAYGRLYYLQEDTMLTGDFAQSPEAE